MGAKVSENVNVNLNMKKTFVGMEIDDYEVRAVEIDYTSHTPKLCTFGKATLTAGTVSEGFVKNPAELANTLEKMWKNQGFKSDKIMLGISSQDILIRFASIPKIQNNIIKQMIRNQSQEYFPVSINDYEMDFMELGTKKVENKETMDIIIVAAKNSLIRGYTASLEIAKLSPHEIDISSLSMMQFAESEYSDATIIMANIGYGKLDLLILNNEIPLFAKTTTFDPTSMLPENINSDPNAEKMSQLYSEISYEIKSLVNYCYSLPDAEPPSVVLLCGPGSQLNGLDMFISNQTKTNNLIINPFKNILLPENIKEKMFFNSAEYTICSSLAQRGLEG